MKTLLRIDSSARTKGSHSREFADKLQMLWSEKNPEGSILLRSLESQSIPHIHKDTITGFHTPKSEHDERLKQATELSDHLIEELRQADELLLSVPMYNFTIPSSLKAYIEQIVRIGETFSMDGDCFQGLLLDKKAYIVFAYGSRFSGTENAPMDFAEPYLKSLLAFIGITDVKVFKLEGATIDEHIFQQSKTEAMFKAAKVFS